MVTEALLQRLSEAELNETVEQLTQLVLTENIDRIKEIFSSLDKDQVKILANARSKADKEPLVYLSIKRDSEVIFDALVEAGSDLRAYYGPNQALHIAVMYGKQRIATKIIDELKIKPEKNLRNLWPSALAAKYNHEHLSKLLDEKEKASGKMSLQDILRSEMGNSYARNKRNNSIHGKARSKL